MNESLDPLEAELGALMPQPTSPELKARIARVMQDSQSDRLHLGPRTDVRRIWSLAFATALAACLVIALFAQRRGRVSPQQPFDEVFRPTLSSAFDESLPTVWTYHRAALASPNQLDELLDKHASESSEPPNHRLHVNAFPMTSNDLESLLGDI
jgi:hypothetical protein